MNEQDEAERGMAEAEATMEGVAGAFTKMNVELESLELNLLLEAVYTYYGFDFRSYAVSTIKRRIWNVIRSEKLHTISALQDRILHDPSAMQRLLVGLTVNVTSMFRDPGFYMSLRQNIIPLFLDYPLIRIWLAGCSTGEEAYSVAILLKEESVYDKCRIYATDINESALKRAKTGKIPLLSMKEFSNNYQHAGGKRSFSEYYIANSDYVFFDPGLRQNMIFAKHDLVTGRCFHEFDILLIRNVMIYFEQALRVRVLDLLHNSLLVPGVIGLGRRESLRNTQYAAQYEEIDGMEKLYRRVA